MDKSKEKFCCSDCEKQMIPVEGDDAMKIINNLAKMQFDIMWEEEKKELKLLSKKGLAEEMFLRGIESVINNIKTANKDFCEEDFNE